MAIVSNVSKYPIELASEDGDTCMIPVGKNISISDKFLVNVLPGIKVIQGKVPTRQSVAKPAAHSKQEEPSSPKVKANKEEEQTEDF